MRWCLWKPCCIVVWLLSCAATGASTTDGDNGHFAIWSYAEIVRRVQALAAGYPSLVQVRQQLSQPFNWNTTRRWSRFGDRVAAQIRCW